jgi:hypothetical protein
MAAQTRAGGSSPIRPVKLAANLHNSDSRAESLPIDPDGPVRETQEEMSEEEWRAFMEQEKARDRKRLEQEAEYSWEARERLWALIEEETKRQAEAACAEDDRRREAIRAEAENSSLNYLALPVISALKRTGTPAALS